MNEKGINMTRRLIFRSASDVAIVLCESFFLSQQQTWS